MIKLKSLLEGSYKFVKGKYIQFPDGELASIPGEYDDDDDDEMENPWESVKESEEEPSKVDSLDLEDNPFDKEDVKESLVKEFTLVEDAHTAVARGCLSEAQLIEEEEGEEDNS